MSAMLAIASARAEEPPAAWKPRLRNDAAEVVGRWIQLKLLQSKLARASGAAAYGDPEDVRKNYRIEPEKRYAWLEKTACAGVGASLVGTLVFGAMASTGEIAGPGKVLKYSVSVGGGTVGVMLSSAGADIAAVTWSGGLHAKSPDAEAAIRYSLDPDKVRKQKAAEVEAANALLQAAFVAELKKTSLEIARRLEAIFGVPESSRLEFERSIERGIQNGFRTQSTWNANSRIQIDVGAILRTVVEDADDRIAAIDGVVRAGRKSAEPETAAEARAAYDGLITESAGLAQTAAETHRTFADRTETPIAAITQEIQEFAVAQEIQTEKLKLHRRLVR